MRNSYNLKLTKNWLLNELDINKRLNVDEKFNKRNISKHEGINISTIHSSKGLEFDVVICPYLWKSVETYNGPLWKDNNKKEFILNIDPSYHEVEDFYIKNKEEDIKECERLTYVALTRSKYKLVVFN